MTTDEWLAWRAGGVGSSDAAALMGESPWMSRFELLLQKTGFITGRIRAPWEWRAMERGRELEPAARRHYEERTGILMPARCVVHPRYPELRASCDGLNREMKRVFEAKVPGKEDHLVACRGEVPRKYLWQCMHLLAVTGMDQVDYYSFRKGDGVLIEVRRDPDLIYRLMIESLRFWAEVKKFIHERKYE